MQIHTVKAGDTIFKIARQYNTPPMKIIENNELENPDRLTPGQKLLILTPTRTYNVRGSDTLEKIAERFGVPYDTLLTNNPYLYGQDKIYPGQILAIKYDMGTYGMACANGYYFKGTSPERLSLALPYLTYLTVSAAKRDGDGIKMLFDDGAVLRAARDKNKIPLLRIYDNDTDFSDSYSEKIAQTAKERNYKGVTLAAYNAMRECKDKYADFLVRLKKKLMEDDLLLFNEIDGNGDTTFPDVCDGYAIMYEKSCLDEIPTFDNGERRVMTNFAERGEAAKAYIEIPSFAYRKDEELTKEQANKLAHLSGREILEDKERGISYFDYNKYKGGKQETVRVAYESPENIKAKLELLAELGYMGICFDIMHIPTEYLMMFNSMFSRPRIYPEM